MSFFGQCLFQIEDCIIVYAVLCSARCVFVYISGPIFGDYIISSY